MLYIYVTLTFSPLLACPGFFQRLFFYIKPLCCRRPAAVALKFITKRNGDTDLKEATDMLFHFAHITDA